METQKQTKIIVAESDHQVVACLIDELQKNGFVIPPDMTAKPVRQTQTGLLKLSCGYHEVHITGRRGILREAVAEHDYMLHLVTDFLLNDKNTIGVINGLLGKENPANIGLIGSSLEGQYWCLETHIPDLGKHRDEGRVGRFIKNGFSLSNLICHHLGIKDPRHAARQRRAGRPFKYES